MNKRPSLCPTFANLVVYAVIGTYLLLAARLVHNYMNLAPQTQGFWNLFLLPILLAEFLLGYDPVVVAVISVGTAVTVVLMIAAVWRIRHEGCSLWKYKRLAVVVCMAPLILPLFSELRMLAVTRSQLMSECELNLAQSARVNSILWPPRFTGSEMTRYIKLSMAKKDVQGFFSRTNSPTGEDWQRYGCGPAEFTFDGAPAKENRLGILPGKPARDEFPNDVVLGFAPRAGKKYLRLEWDAPACDKTMAILEYDDSDLVRMYLYIWVRYR